MKEAVLPTTLRKSNTEIPVVFGPCRSHTGTGVKESSRWFNSMYLSVARTLLFLAACQ